MNPPWNALYYMREHGKCEGQAEDEWGRVCIIGALNRSSGYEQWIMQCQPLLDTVHEYYPAYFERSMQPYGTLPDLQPLADFSDAHSQAEVEQMLEKAAIKLDEAT